MKKIDQVAYTVFFAVVALCGCSKHLDTNVSELERQFSITVPLSDMNNSLQIATNSQDSTFKSGSEIELTIYNKSLHSLYFDNITHMRLFSSSDNLHWTEVKNAITYTATMILSPEGTILLDTQYTSVKPIVDQSEFDINGEDILLRIVIIGEIMNGEVRTKEKVGAYVDVVLKP